MIRVSSVTTEPEFTLSLQFTNGEQRRFDMGPCLHLLVFRPLENPGFFCLHKFITAPLYV